MIKHILLATNGSPASQSAEDYALYLAATLQAKLTVVHIQDNRLAHYGEVDQLVTEVTKKQFVTYVNENNDAATRRIIDGFGAKAERLGVKHAMVVQSGSPDHKIVALAKANAADLLVIGSGSRSARRFKPASGLAGKIVKNSPCPVFTAI